MIQRWGSSWLTDVNREHKITKRQIYWLCCVSVTDTTHKHITAFVFKAFCKYFESEESTGVTYMWKKLFRMLIYTPYLRVIEIDEAFVIKKKNIKF